MADRGNLARVLRKMMRVGIVNIERVVDELENFHIDDAEPGDDWFIKPASVLVFKCEDFAGNFCSPFYGELRPGADYLFIEATFLLLCYCRYHNGR